MGVDHFSNRSICWEEESCFIGVCAYIINYPAYSNTWFQLSSETCCTPSRSCIDISVLINSFSQAQKSKKQNIWQLRGDHVPPPLPPVATQPSTSSFSSLLSWLQSKATLLQDLTSRAPTATRLTGPSWAGCSYQPQEWVRLSLHS